MRVTTLLYQFEEAGKNIRRNGLMSLAALSTVLLAMAVLGAVSYALYRLHQFADSQPRQMEMEVFLNTGVERAKTLETIQKIQQLPGVAYAVLYPREKAWQAMQHSVSSNGQALGDALGDENPLPDRIDVKPKDPQDTLLLAAALRNVKAFPDIHKVLDSREDLDNLLRLNRLVTNIGSLAGIALFLATALVIQNTIRLTVFARRKEIRIMQLVGATSGFIRLPMILEGIIYGVFGAAAAAGLVLLLANQISQYTNAFASPLTQNLPPAIAPIVFFGVLTGIGALVGWMGSLLSLRKFLKRI